MTKDAGYWYLASYPKSGNTWCRVFITELRRLSGESEQEELHLNQDISTGSIASSRLWLDDQLGINTCDLSFGELDPLRGNAGTSQWVFAEGERFHKTHDAFRSPDSRGRAVVSTQGCNGVVYLLRHPEDVAISLSNFFSWPIQRCIEFLIDSEAALIPSMRHGGGQVRQHMGRWDQHVRSWSDQTVLPVLTIRYEDMLGNAQETFTHLARFLGLPSDSNLIEQTIINTSIEKLQTLEAKVGGFAEKPKGCDRFFRSGRSGEGAEKLSLEQRQRLEESLSATMKRFGYTGPTNQ
mgnify:CR=1 FL=1